jgi:hypothetical protein
VTAAASIGSSSSPAAADPNADILYDAAFIQSMQLPDGAITSTSDLAMVEPYVAGYAAWGLAVAARRSPDGALDAAAWRWLTWYAAHQDEHGYVADYRRTGDGLESIGDTDSTDAASGIFLIATWAASALGPADLPRLRALWPQVILAVSAIESTMDSDGLTWAKPSWHVKYLMDNAEALAGLDAAAAMARPGNDPALGRRAAADAKRIRAGIASLWNPATGAYDWALHASGVRIPADWTVLYPDSVEQAWAVAFGAVPAARAKQLMSTFQVSQPNWDRPGATANYYDGYVYPSSVGFWPIAALALQRVGRAGSALAGARNIRDGAWAIDRRSPFGSGSQGQLIGVESGQLVMPPAG